MHRPRVACQCEREEREAKDPEDVLARQDLLEEMAAVHRHALSNAPGGILSYHHAPLLLCRAQATARRAAAGDVAKNVLPVATSTRTTDLEKLEGRGRDSVT